MTNMGRNTATFFLFVGLRYTDQNFKVRRSEKNKNKNGTLAQNRLNYHNFGSITSCDEKHDNLQIYLSLKDQIMSNYFSFYHF